MGTFTSFLFQKKMLDILLFRDGAEEAQPDMIKESQKRRFAKVELVDEVIQLDKDWRKAEKDVDDQRRDLNKLNKEIGQRKKNKLDCSDIFKQIPEEKKKLAELEAVSSELNKKRDEILRTVGNIVHQSVPISDDEDNNQVLTNFGERKPADGLLHHHELLHMIDGYDREKGIGVSGNRGYFLTGPAVLLNFALINYGLQFLMKKNYKPIQVPYMMNKNVMAEVAQLSQFDEELYKVSGGHNEQYLIATSEQPLAGFNRDERYLEQDLKEAKKFAGFSTCFRKEAGKTGQENWGIFRVHQFDKVEQFIVCNPESSWQELDTMIGTSEEFYQSLGIPYRTVAIVSGALNDAAAKKIDLEAFFPSVQDFKELVSCSNCTDYQSRRLRVHYGQVVKGKQSKKFVHMLNGTLCATSRTICAILENYQTDKGINIPKVLQPYMMGMEFIPFVKEKPNFEEINKKNKKAGSKGGKQQKK